MYVQIHSVAEGIASISLSNPKMNVLSNQVKREIKDVFSQISKHPDVRVILFETEGPHFCCGADLKEFPERIENKSAGKAWDEGHLMLKSIMNAPQPTIACIQGNALGGGAELAMAFDFRIFAENAQIGFPEVTRGVFPGNGGLERMMDIAGAGNAMKLMVTGSVIQATEAKSMGMATEVVPANQLPEAAEELAGRLASLPATAVQAAKRAVNQYIDSRNDFDRFGRELFRQVHESDDVREGINAFFEKRKPVFKHR